jgi:hypothetical protein
MIKKQIKVFLSFIGVIVFSIELIMYCYLHYNSINYLIVMGFAVFIFFMLSNIYSFIKKDVIK